MMGSRISFAVCKSWWNLGALRLDGVTKAPAVELSLASVVTAFVRIVMNISGRRCTYPASSDALFSGMCQF